MELKITLLEESPFSYGDVVALMHDSFEERLQQGLRFTCSSLTEEAFKEKTKKGKVLVAWDAEKESLLGTATVTLRRDGSGRLYGYNEYLAISPSAKRLGIGTRLLKERIIIITDAAGEYVLSDTAVGAKSSVKWHLKNGFRKVALKSYESTNYYSYLFRKQLVHPSKWDSRYYTAWRFCLSSIKTHLLLKRDGSPRFKKTIIKAK